MKVAIVGAAGYSGEELVHILSRHPDVELAVVTSRQHAGKVISDVIPTMRNLDNGLSFSASDPQTLASNSDIDIVFLALPHGVASEYAVPLAEAGKVVIDLSADFRLNSTDLYKKYYGQEHPAPEWLTKAPYVLADWADDSWKESRLIACPGCYPTSVLLPLLPLIRENVITGEGIVINSYSGVSGAGKKVDELYLFSERTDSVTAYGLGTHRHLSEIEEQLSLEKGEEVVVQFTPHLVPMKRGIASTICISGVNGTIEDVYHAWKNAYAAKPFVNLLPSGKSPDTKYIQKSNRIDFSGYLDERTGNLLITSAEDNLVKGASGQAVQIMNLFCGYQETAGLV